MKFSHKIVFSNIVMVAAPVVFAAVLWLIYALSNSGYFVEGGSGSFAGARQVLTIYRENISQIKWYSFKESSGADDYLIDNETQLIKELEGTGLRLNVVYSGATIYSNLLKKDMNLVHYFSKPSTQIEENRILIRDFVEQEGKTFSVTAIYDGNAADEGVKKSLVPIYLVSSRALFVFFVLCVLFVVALNFLLTGYITKAATLERQIQNLNEMAKMEQAQVVAKVGGERFAAETLSYVEQNHAGAEKNSTRKIELDSLCINLDGHQVTLDGSPVELKNKEFELLAFLALNRGIVFSREVLYDRVWGEDAFGDFNTVTVHINRLREKLEKNPQEPQFIVTVWGAGYKFL